jgi:transcriptional regulator with XRE-family HTH domain
MEILTSTKLEDTFGYKIACQRLRKRWSEADLADHVNALQLKQKKLSGDDVYRWETNQEVPSDDMLEMLINILIDDNQHSSTKEKITARQTFVEAAARTRQALEEGQISPELHAFSVALRKYRSAAGFDSEGALAEAIESHRHAPQIDDITVWKYEHGHEVPPRNILVKIMRVLSGGEAEISPEEKLEIYDAYEAASKTIGILRQSGIACLKEQLRGFFVDVQGARMSQDSIAEVTTLSQSTVSRIFDPNSLRSIDAEAIIKIEDGLRRTGATEKELHQVHLLIQLLNNVTAEERYTTAMISR